MEKQSRYSFVEPEFMNGQGYKLVSDEDGYLKYVASWELKALTLKGHKYEQLLGNGKRFVYFNINYVGYVGCNIREDGDTRTVFQAMLYENDGDYLIKTLNQVF